MSHFLKTIYLLASVLYTVHCQLLVSPTKTNSSGEYYIGVDVTFYDGDDTRIYCNHTELCYIQCNTYYGCKGLNVTALNEVSNVEIQCNESYSCQQMAIHQLTATYLTIECADYYACNALVVESSDVSNMALYCGRVGSEGVTGFFCSDTALYELNINHLVIECRDVYSCYSMNIHRLTTTSLTLECTESAACVSFVLETSVVSNASLLCAASGSCYNMEISNNSVIHINISCDDCSYMKYSHNTGIDATISCDDCSYSYWNMVNYNQVSLNCDESFSCHSLDLICPVHYHDNVCSVTCNNDYSCEFIEISSLDEEFHDYFVDLQCYSDSVTNRACNGATITCKSAIHSTDVSTSIYSNECSNIYCCPWESAIDELNDIDYCSDDEHCDLLCNYACRGVVDAFQSLSLMMSCSGQYVCEYTTIICPQYGDCLINCDDEACGYVVINATLSQDNAINLLCNDKSCENIVVFGSQSTSQINILCNDESCAQSQFHLRDADNVVIYAMGDVSDEGTDDYVPSRRRLQISESIHTLSNAWIDVTNTQNVDIFASGYSLHNSIIFGNESSAIHIVCPEYSCYDTDIYCPNHVENSCNIICDTCNGTVIHFDQEQTTRNWFHLEVYNDITDVKMDCNSNDTTTFSSWEDQVVCDNDVCCPFSTYEDAVIGAISIPSDDVSRFYVSAQVYIKTELAFDAECTDCFEWYIKQTNMENVFVSVNDVYGRDESVTLYNTKIGSYITDDNRQEYDIFEANLVIRSVLDENAGYCYQQKQSDNHIIQHGTNYEVRLDILSETLLNTVYPSDTVSVTTGAPPSGGHCTITNNDDMRVFSNFSIECSGWESSISSGNTLRYNALIQNVAFLDEFSTNVSALTGIVGIGDIQITALIQDYASFTACYVINTTFPSLSEVLEKNDSVTDIAEDIDELLQETQANHVMISIYSVIEALNGSQTSRWVNTLIDDIISDVLNETVAVERVLSDVTTLTTLTSNPNAVETETVSNIAEGYLDYISESISEYVSNDTINADTLYSLVTESQKIIHNLENVVKVSTKKASNHVSSVLVDKSLLFAHLSLLKSLPGEFYRFISDTVYSEKVISATKFENVYNSSSNVTHQCGHNNQFLNIPRIFNQQNIGIYDCAFVTGTDNFMVNNSDYEAVSDLVSVQIYDNASAMMQETDACNPYLISINVNSKSVLNNNANSYTLDERTVFPRCNFWDEEWSDYGCVVHEFSEDNDRVICACEHLTTFEISKESFNLEANVIAQYDIRNVTAQNLEKYPVVWVTILIVGVLLIMLCCWNPIKEDRSSLAYEDIIFTKVRDERLKNDIAGKEIEIIGKHLPNAHFIGHGLTKMAQDKSGAKSLCLLQLHLYLIYLGNDHTFWSIFQRTSGTNFSTKQRIGCFFMYLSLIMVSSALFYGQQQTTKFGDVSASFIISLCSTVPVFFVKKLFINSKPKIIKRSIHIHGESKDEEEPIKNIDDDEELEYNEYRQTKKMSSTYYKSINTIKKNKMKTKVSTLYIALGEVNKAHSKQHRITLVDDVRKILYDTIYPLEYKWRLYAWIIIGIITCVCCIIAIIYGLQFDAGYQTVNNADYSGDITLFDEECWNNNKQLWLEYTLSLQKIEQLRAELEYRFIDNYKNCSESMRWLINCGVSLLWSWFLWQPLNIFIMTFIKVWMFTWNLKMGLSPANVRDLMRYSCCKKSVPDVDDVEVEMGGDVSKHRGPSYLAISNKNRPLDIIGYLSNDDLFLKTNRDSEKEIELVSLKSNGHMNTDKANTDDQQNEGEHIDNRWKNGSKRKQ